MSSSNRREDVFMIQPQIYRTQDIRANLRHAGLPVLDVMLTGVTGAGKSSTINRLFGSNRARVGYGVEPMTMTNNAYCLQNAMRFWDTPGLGDGKQQDKLHEESLINLLYKTWEVDQKKHGFIDMAVVIVEGSNRDMGTTFHLLRNVVLPCIEPERVVVAINQADVAMKGRFWDDQSKRPLPPLQQFLEQQAESVQRRINESCGIKINKPIYYSAEHNFNIDVLLDQIIDAMPSERRNLK